jgi:NTP pyrophosphatase (non-canonical NTP hydrolase)
MSAKRNKWDQSAQIVLFPSPAEDGGPQREAVPGDLDVRSPKKERANALAQESGTSVVICGSYRRDVTGLALIHQHFLDLNCRILSPSNVDIQREAAGFVYMRGEETQTPEKLERRHLDAIEQADFVWLHAPEGYVGLSGSLEIGYANAVGTPIFSSATPQDAVLATMVKVVDGPERLVPRPQNAPIDVPRPATRRFQDYYRKAAIRRGYEKESAQNCLLLMIEEIGELARGLRHEEKLVRHHGTITETPPELADVFIYVIHMANILDVDLATVVRDKERENWERFARKVKALG